MSEKRELTAEEAESLKQKRLNNLALARQKRTAKNAAKKLSLATEDEVTAYSTKDEDDTARLTRAFEAALRTVKGDEAYNQESFVEALAESHRRLVRPENASPPMISAFNPLGERDHPRPKFICPKIKQCGFPVDWKRSTPEEITHLNMLCHKVIEAHRENKSLPEFMVSKADGSQAYVTLEAKWDGISNQLEELNINYPVKTLDLRSGLYSFNMMLEEMLGLDSPKVDVQALRARISHLETENAALRAG